MEDGRWIWERISGLVEKLVMLSFTKLDHDCTYRLTLLTQKYAYVPTGQDKRTPPLRSVLLDLEVVIAVDGGTK